MYAHLDQTFNQMTEYRARTIAMDSDHQGLVGPPASSQALEEPPAFMSLAEQYGLTDEDLGASESVLEVIIHTLDLADCTLTAG
jgi:hypothetical protein